MTKAKNLISIVDEVAMNKIYFIRGQKVMLDSPDSYRDGRVVPD